MKALTSQEFQELLGKIKAFLEITWTDTETDNQITDFINSSINDLDRRAGAELDYLLIPSNSHPTTQAEQLYESMSYKAQELLKHRVFYCREKALDDFNKNYLGDLNELYILGKAYKTRLSINVEQQ